MPLNWRTETGYRPDLAALEVNPVFNYIGRFFYPVEVKTEKTGDFTFQTVVPDADASTSYSDGAELGITDLNLSPGSWNCKAIAKRYGVTKKEVYNYGSVEKADIAGATGAIRSVMATVEKRQLAKLISGTSKNLVDGKIFTSLQKAVDGIRRYPGQKAIAMNFTTFRALTQTNEFKSALLRNGWIMTADQVLGTGTDLLLKYLSQILVIEKAFIADDDYMTTGYIVVAALPIEEEISYKDRPELGKTMVFIPDGGKEFDIETDVEVKSRRNLYTAESYVDVVEMNSGARKVFVLTVPDESSSSGSGSAAPDESSSSGSQSL